MDDGRSPELIEKRGWHNLRNLLLGTASAQRNGDDVVDGATLALVGPAMGHLVTRSQHTPVACPVVPKHIFGTPKCPFSEKEHGNSFKKGAKNKRNPKVVPRSAEMTGHP
ncbi:hypothetical protein AVEN_263937-1 [Araneus ventricosus]|uniref:Uncharacterized protein n=1 Tax=Araneus ventricosus TaxID=182803 RepID=A0A4Y2K3N6_ARAVE|nr:hypothetical protein AVEN_263937-1 [Araneus ventricosus]